MPSCPGEVRRPGEATDEWSSRLGRVRPLTADELTQLHLGLADRIETLDRGRVTEHGTHDELMAIVRKLNADVVEARRGL